MRLLRVDVSEAIIGDGKVYGLGFRGYALDEVLHCLHTEARRKHRAWGEAMTGSAR